MSIADNSFGTFLRTLRIAANLSQEDLAARAGLSVQAIGTLERGQRRAPYRQTVDALANALDLETANRAAFGAAARRFRQPSVAAKAATAAPAPHNLPPTPTRLIGRDDALTAAAALLTDPTVRLLTITGPAGVGKTRLALALAAAQLPTFPDGVWFVDLAPIHDPDRVLAAIAQTLGVIAQGATPFIETLQAAIQPKRLLLVLDNIEQLLSATPTLDLLLTSCPQLRLLVTSRATLPTSWAREFVLPPLTLPSANVSEPAELALIPAVAFFLQSAHASVPDFQLTPGNAPAIAALCRHLDGLPLALELAAIRLRLLPPAELLARLTDRFGLLRSTQADRPARHLHLRETLAWSERLLSPAQQQLFGRLAVFAGGATVAAIEAVCAAPGMVVLDELAVLVEHHLVQRVLAAGETVRLTQLETIREYALEQLRATGDEANLLARHADYYCQQVEGLELRLVGPDQLRLFTWCDQEQENLRAALSWCRSQDEQAQGLHLCWELWRWWSARGFLTEARQWFDTFLEPTGQLLPDIPALDQALGLFAAARLAYEHGDLLTAQQRAEQSRHLTQAHALVNTGDGALTILANLAFRRGDYRAAGEYHAEALQLRRNGAHHREIAISLSGLGKVANANADLALAKRYYRQALDLTRSVGDGQLTATVLISLSGVEQQLGNMVAAQDCALDALALTHDLDERQLLAQALRRLANLAIYQGSYRQARAYLDESVLIAQTIGSSELLSVIVDDYAQLLATLDEQALLLQLTSAAAISRSTRKILLTPHQQAAIKQLIGVAEHALGPAETARQQASGAALTIHQALQLAQRWCAAALPDEA